MNCHVPHMPSKGLTFETETKCQRHLSKMADINFLIQRAIGGDTSVFRSGTYADLSQCPESLQDALNTQRKAIEAYEALPPEVRARYTSPLVFFEAANTPEGRKEFLRYGLAFERTPEGPIEVKVINPVTAKADASSTDAACS